MNQLILLILFFCLSVVPAGAQEEARVLNGDECVALGGEIVNTLGGESCGKAELLGKVSGMRCPCICCKKAETVQEEPVFDGEQCAESGGYVKLDPGGGGSCEEGEESLGFIPVGYEGGICCRKK